MDRNALNHLADFNRSMDQALTALETMAKYPELAREDFIIVQAQLREQVGHANVMVLAAFEEWQQTEILAAYRIRVAYEDKVRDPDDCYFEVARREEERRKQDLPPLIGILRLTAEIEAEGSTERPLGDAAEAGTS